MIADVFGFSGQFGFDTAKPDGTPAPSPSRCTRIDLEQEYAKATAGIEHFPLPHGTETRFVPVTALTGSAL
jgi:hypothetical protein